MTESSSESLSWNMKPRPNMQLAAACCVCRALFLGKSVKPESTSGGHVTPGARKEKVGGSLGRL